MKKFLTILAFSAAAAYAADFAWELRCEMQYTDAELPDVVWSQGSTPLIAARTYERGKAVPPREDVTVQMMIAPTPVSQYWAVVTNQATNATSYLLQWPTIGTNTTASAPWYYVVYYLSGGHRYWTGSGSLWIEETTATGDGLVWQEIASVDLVEVSNRLARVEGIAEEAAEAVGGVTNRLEQVENDVSAISTNYLPKGWTNIGALAQLQLGDGTYDRLEGWLADTPWLTPSRFQWEVEWNNTQIVTESNQALGPYSFSVKAVTVEKSQQATLRPDIVRNQWEDVLQASVSGPAALSEQGDGSYLLSWLPGATPGVDATVIGRLGDWVESQTLTMPEASSIVTQFWFQAWADGAVGAALDDVRADWQALPGSQYRFSNYSASRGATPGTFTLIPNPNFFAKNCDLSGVSVWNDSGWYYTKPCTLISSNIAIGASHWSMPVGSTVAFWGKDGALHFTRIMAQRKVAGDLAFSLLSPAIPAEAATAYAMLDMQEAHKATLPPEGTVYNKPKPPILSCSQACTAWCMGGGDFWSWSGMWYSINGYWSGEAWAPHSRQKMVGGDSGHPQFLSTDGTNLVLIGCAYTASSCSYPGANPETVEDAVRSLAGEDAAVQWETWTEWPKYSGIPM